MTDDKKLCAELRYNANHGPYVTKVSADLQHQAASRIEELSKPACAEAERNVVWPSFPSAMKDYRKKPVVVQALQWFEFGDHSAVVPYSGNGRYADIDRDRGKPSIKTLEGDIHFVTPGDWIITGIKGEHYACKDDIFKATYEPVGDCSTSKGEGNSRTTNDPT